MYGRRNSILMVIADGKAISSTRNNALFCITSQKNIENTTLEPSAVFIILKVPHNPQT